MNIAEKNKKTETQIMSIPVPYLNGAMEVAKEIAKMFIVKIFIGRIFKHKIQRFIHCK